MREYFLGNLLLAIAWTFVTGQFTVWNLAVGFTAGYLVLYLTRHAIGASGYTRRVRDVVELFCFFVWELIRANLQVAHDVITPRFHMRPAIVAVPLEARGDLELLLLTSIITLTPGDIVLEVSDDRKTLYIHAMYMQEAEEYRSRIKEKFERRIMEVMR